MKNKIKVTKLTEKFLKQLLGKQLPTYKDGHAGRALENLLETFGFDIDRRSGVDIKVYGLEVKTRSLIATSAQTVTTMYACDISEKSYKESPVYEKFQQQLRIKLDENNIIVAADIYDFDQPQIQEQIERAYEKGRQMIIANPDIRYTPYVSGQYGYFEQVHLPQSTAYSFRLSDKMMIDLEHMAKNEFKNLFEYA